MATSSSPGQLVLIAAVAAGCGQSTTTPIASPPADQPMVTAVVDAAPPPPPLFAGPLTSEEGTLALFQSLMVELGAETAATVKLELDTMIPMPSYGRSTIITRPYMSQPDDLEPHLALVSHLAFADRLTYFDHFADGDDEARQAYQVFMAVALGHELCHHVVGKRFAIDRDDRYTNEMVAIDFELAMLAELLRREAVPARWIELYRRFNQALLAALPATAVARWSALGEEQRRETFNAHIDDYFRGVADAARNQLVNEEIEAAEMVMIAYTVKRLDLVARLSRDPGGYPPLAGLVTRYDLPGPSKSMFDSKD